MRRKAAGEHTIPSNTIIDAFASEWGLTPSEIAALYRAAVEEERQNEVRRKA